MYSFFSRLGAWLLTKVAVAALIVVCGLAAYAGWIFLRDRVLEEDRRAERVAELNSYKERLVGLRAELAAQVTAIQSQTAAQQDRLERAGRVVAALRELESWWERFFGNAEQQAANAEQLQKLQGLQESTRAQILELSDQLAQTEQRLAGTSEELRSVEHELLALEAAESELIHYVRAAWAETRLYLAIALATYFFGPTLWKLFAYYGLAPLLARGRPIRFAPDPGLLPDVGSSHVSVDAPIWPGEILRVKEKFLQASDEGMSRKTRWVLDWRIPFTSIACGLIELVEMRNGQARGEARVTFSNSTDPHQELAIISVPDGSSLILRPSFLAGVIVAADQPLKIRRRWVIFRWQSWVTLQFRFFEFAGPCRLIVVGSRGVRAERLVDQEGMTRPARRTNQQATIGFTPNLDYLPVRAETFWGYYRNMNPLFDDLFAGVGLFVLQETSQVPEGHGPGRFWSGLWNGLLKVFGL